MSDNEEITLKDIAEATAKMLHDEPTSEQIKEAYRKTEYALHKLLSCSELVKKKAKELGIIINNQEK